jgi:hypothetical protein
LITLLFQGEEPLEHTIVLEVEWALELVSAQWRTQKYKYLLLPDVES